MKSGFFLFGLVLMLGAASAGGWLDFIFGPSPSSPAAGSPNQTAVTAPSPQMPQVIAPTLVGQGEEISGGELGQIISILNSMLESVMAIAQNTEQTSDTVVTGNIVLFDNNGNYNNQKNQGNHVIALPSGNCEIAVFAGPMIDVELSEMNSYSDRRSEQKCESKWVCRKTVKIDGNYPFLKLFWVESDSKNSDTARATLAYRCVEKRQTKSKSNAQ